MGRPRKKPSEWTTEEAVKKLFPKPAVKRLKKAAEEAEKSSKNRIPKEKS
jgi:hypothetical protein